MKNLLLVFLLSVGAYLNAQDLDIYKHQKNSNFEIPDIPQGMTYNEFKILSTNLRMQDMAMAVVLPGHAHFKIGEKTTGYYIMGARMTGYLGWAYLALIDESLTGIVFKDNLNIESDVSTGDEIIAYGSVVLMLGSYVYDWIHAKYKLDDKQTKIRYKYAKKRLRISMSGLHYNYNNRNYPALSLTYHF